MAGGINTIKPNLPSLSKTSSNIKMKANDRISKST